MFSIFQNIHTYLLISFVVMIVFVIKLCYKKVDTKLNQDIDSIKNSLNNLEQQKLESINQIASLRNELSEVNANIAQTIAEAEKKAKEITEASNKNIEQTLKEKQIEHAAALQKLDQGFVIELKNKLVALILQDLEDKLNGQQNSREFQNLLIENSIDDLEKLVRQYIK